jgi:hypothetical protein
MTSKTHLNPVSPGTPPDMRPAHLEPHAAYGLLMHYIEEAITPVTHYLVASAEATRILEGRNARYYPKVTNDLRSLQADLPAIITGLHKAVYGTEPASVPTFSEPPANLL